MGSRPRRLPTPARSPTPPTAQRSTVGSRPRRLPTPPRTGTSPSTALPGTRSRTRRLPTPPRSPQSLHQLPNAAREVEPADFPIHLARALPHQPPRAHETLALPTSHSPAHASPPNGAGSRAQSSEAQEVGPIDFSLRSARRSHQRTSTAWEVEPSDSHFTRLHPAKPEGSGVAQHEKSDPPTSHSSLRAHPPRRAGRGPKRGTASQPAGGRARLTELRPANIDAAREVDPSDFSLHSNPHPHPAERCGG